MNVHDPINVWIIVAVVFFIVEIASPTILVFACFGLGALAAALTVWLTPNVWLPWLVFIAISVVGVVVSRPLAEKYAGKSARLAHVDALIGLKGKVTTAIDPLKNEGMVLVEKESWRAQATEPINEGADIEVVKVEGTHLVVKKVI